LLSDICYLNSMIKLALIQTHLHWENPTANRAMLEEKIANLAQPVDLIVLPEMFTSGFTMNPAAVAEPMNLTTHRWMRQMAAQTGAVLTGSYVVQEKGLFYNRLLWVEPDGTTDCYDKRHLFRMGGENNHYMSGERRIIKELNGWRICPLICYDLRFPVWSRNVDLAYDVLLYIANWPAARQSTWETLLRARAIENQCYAIGVNRIGDDANGMAHAGGSGVIDYLGQPLSANSDAETIIYGTLQKEPLTSYRERFPAYLDTDTFEIS
jgi:omega-amidase